MFMDCLRVPAPKLAHRASANPNRRKNSRMFCSSWKTYFFFLKTYGERRRS